MHGSKGEDNGKMGLRAAATARRFTAVELGSTQEETTRADLIAEYKASTAATAGTGRGKDQRQSCL